MTLNRKTMEEMLPSRLYNELSQEEAATFDAELSQFPELEAEYRAARALQEQVRANQNSADETGISIARLTEIIEKATELHRQEEPETREPGPAQLAGSWFMRMCQSLQGPQLATALLVCAVAGVGFYQLESGAILVPSEEARTDRGTPVSASEYDPAKPLITSTSIAESTGADVSIDKEQKLTQSGSKGTTVSPMAVSETARSNSSQNPEKTGGARGLTDKEKVGAPTAQKSSSNVSYPDEAKANIERPQTVIAEKSFNVGGLPSGQKKKSIGKSRARKKGGSRTSTQFAPMPDTMANKGIASNDDTFMSAKKEVQPSIGNGTERPSAVQSRPARALPPGKALNHEEESDEGETGAFTEKLSDGQANGNKRRKIALQLILEGELDRGIQMLEKLIRERKPWSAMALKSGVQQLLAQGKLREAGGLLALAERTANPHPAWEKALQFTRQLLK